MSETVDLETALNQMEKDGTIPDGFHMMFFSDEFKLTEDCTMNKMLKMITESFQCADTLKRQIYQMPDGRNIITYEFAWIGDFSKIQSVMEEMDSTINDGIKRIMAANEMENTPQRRIQFLTLQEDNTEF
tara:strand:+ start:10348 stop:10737 length:390 start_codon:yes stop_codon:yes gene_type:complete